MKSKSTFTVIFFTRKSRSNSNKLSIYVRVTVKGKRAEISLKRSILQNQWDSTKNRGRGNTEKIKVLNAYLDQVYNKLLECHKELLEEDKVVSSDAIKSRYLGEDDNSKTLKELIAYHNGNMIHVLKSGTMKNYYTTERYLQKFLQKKKRLKDIYLKQLNYRFITDFEYYLRTYKNSKKELMISNNGVMKHLERFKKMINLAIKLEWMHKGSVASVKIYNNLVMTRKKIRLIFRCLHFLSFLLSSNNRVKYYRCDRTLESQMIFIIMIFLSY